MGAAPCVRPLRCLVLAAVLAAPWPALAQDSTEQTSAEQVIEEIVVVGSLIRRAAVYEGRAPVQTLDAAAFEAAGAAQPVDILASLTANTGSYLATQQTYLQGVAQFSLRGVGLSSTLTLINGRRAGFAPVSNDVGQSFFDINTLPVLMIDRVEILRDGASATYGSQAVAGVANIVTRKGFTGFEIAGGYRDASNQAYDLSFASGLETERSHISLYGSWYEQDENFRTEFDWLIPRAIDPDGDGDIVDGSFDSGRGSPGSLRRAVANPDGSYSPFQVNGFDTPRFPDPDCRAGGGYPSGALCRMDFSDQRTMIAAEQRVQLFAEADFYLGPVTLFSEIGYSANDVTDRVGNMLLFNGNVERTNEFFVPANHPFNFWTDPDGDGALTYVAPSDWNPGVHEAVPLGYFGRPLGAEAAGRNSGDEVRAFDSLRTLVGFEAELPGGWTGEGHFTRARTDLSVRSERHWIASEFARALTEGRWNPFGTRLVAPDLVTPKTVADDGLAPALAGRRAANDPETLKRFESVRRESARSIQNVAELVATSEAFEWGGQPVTLAVGTQYRELSYAFRPDPLNATGEGPRAIIELPAAAEQRTWALFAESLVQFGHRAELQVAARHERYDRAGNSTDPKIAAQFFASDWLSLRASWGTSFQAPSVFQVAGNTSSRTLTDPFRFDGQGVGSCTVDASGAILNRGDNFAVATLLRGGGLRPQTAHLANFGVLLQPLENAAVSLDYWTLHYRDVIAQGRSFQAIVDDDCRDDGQPNDARVRRDTSGQLSVVTTDYGNVGAVRTQGLDLNAYYDLALSAGDLRISADATLLTRFDVDAAGEGFVDRLGSRNDTNGFAPTPELRFNLGVAWRQERHAAGLTVRYVDAYRNDEVASLPKIASWTTLDVNYAYTAPNLFGSEATLYLGARNLTDRDPPPLPTGRDGVQRHNLRPGYDGFVHDIKGRTLYARFRLRLGR
ncbi:MAG: TonB-dependent receptor [Gammaproteobacteria bacterium]|nr:TonB-dependent receptor [Gammaproteobacteria bacterium]